MNRKTQNMSSFSVQVEISALCYSEFEEQLSGSPARNKQTTRKCASHEMNHVNPSIYCTHTGPLSMEQSHRL